MLWRAYPAGSRVKEFDLNFDPKEKEALNRVAALWKKEKHGFSDFSGVCADPLQVKSDSFGLKPGQVKQIFD